MSPQTLEQRLARKKLGEHRTQILLHDRDDNRLVAAALATQARRSLYIASWDLDPYVYDQPDFVQSVSALARSSRYADVRILIRDNGIILKQGHGLVRLYQRIPSRVQLRRQVEDMEPMTEAFLVADQDGYLHRRLADRYDGEARFHALRRARELVTLFKQAWEQSLPDPSLRRLT
ncbi:MAG: hypothetical protein PHQ14_10195 [Chromatiales bacterium]|jgi:hypothetical protein|nr:hypothetical protein [Chromatiales bacterium]MDX9766788.1 acyltransferase [Ectothiorhodospiraceae bacterium]